MNARELDELLLKNIISLVFITKDKRNKPTDALY